MVIIRKAPKRKPLPKAPASPTKPAKKKPSKSAPKPRIPSKPERDLTLQIRLSSLPTPEAEHRFHPVRKWRFDLCWPDHLLAVEIMGGGRGNGRHHRNEGYKNDCEKKAFAMIAGWRVLYVVPEQIKSGEALSWITQLLAMPGTQEGEDKG